MERTSEITTEIHPDVMVFKFNSNHRSKDLTSDIRKKLLKNRDIKITHVVQSASEGVVILTVFYVEISTTLKEVIE